MRNIKLQVMDDENAFEEGRELDLAIKISQTLYKTAETQAMKMVDRLAEVVLIDSHWLSTHLIDALAEQQQDWIARLQPGWDIELEGLSLLGMDNVADSSKHARLAIKDLLALIPQASYQLLEIAEQTHWISTCCLHVAGLGRVRLVVCFNDLQQTEDYAAFLSNCLDWSPRKIIAQWVQNRPLANFYDNQNTSESLAVQGVLT